MGRIRSTTTQELGPAYRVPDEADAVLTNWARWAAPAGRGGATAPGFRYFKRNQRDDAHAGHTAPAPLAGSVDQAQARLAERVLCSPAFWPAARTILIAHYLHRADQRSTCRVLGIQRGAYDFELWRAACMFLNRFKQAQTRLVVPTIY